MSVPREATLAVQIVRRRLAGKRQAMTDVPLYRTTSHAAAPWIAMARVCHAVQVGCPGPQCVARPVALRHVDSTSVSPN